MKKIIFAVVVVVTVLLGMTIALADDWEVPTSFEVQSEQGSEVFRFNPDPADRTATAALYKNANSTEVIYTVKNLRSHAYKSSFFFSDDLRQFAFIPPADFDIAVEFYSNGSLTKSYTIKELVKDHSKIMNSVSSAHWRSTTTGSIQDQNTLQITTVDNITYTFDITTGEILQSTGGLGVKEFIFGVVGVGILGGLVFLFIQYRRKN